MKDSPSEQTDQKLAQALLDAGWRQGSAFKLSNDVHCNINIDRDKEWVVVCTQSCSVVSPRFNVDPNVELMVAAPVERLKHHSPEAKGKNVRKFHIPFSEHSAFQALECDINRRFFIPRRELVNIEPLLSPTETDMRAFGGWLARYYSRIALPNELVRRAQQEGGLFEKIRKLLEARYRDEARNHYVDAIYINWSPQCEVTGEENYQLDLFFLCSDIEAFKDLEDAAYSDLDEFTKPNVKDRIVVEWSAGERSSTTLGSITGYTRLSEWDYMSDLGSVARESQKTSL